MQSFDPIQLQRLIDGELGLDETQSLLRAAETKPELWRAMATAFVENRVWQNGFCQSNAAAKSCGPTSKSDSAGETKSSRHPGRKKRDDAGHTTARWWFSLAAGMMLATAVGFAAGQWKNGGSSTATDIADIRPAIPEADASPRLNQMVYRPDYRMQFEDSAGNPLMESEIPLYHARKAQAIGLTLQPHAISDDVRREMRNSGYEMKQDVQYFSGRMSDGRQFVVPIRKIKFVPGQ